MSIISSEVTLMNYSALCKKNKKLLLARAIPIFMPDNPQVRYLDIFVGKNKHAADEKAGAGAYKEINRTNITLEKSKELLQKKILTKQINGFRFRNTFPAFGFDVKLKVLKSEQHELRLTWENNSYSTTLEANLKNYSFNITNL